MKVLAVIAIIIIILILLISVGVDVAYENNVFRLCATLCGIKVQLLPKDENAPKKPKKEKKKKKEEPPAEETTEEKPKKKLNIPFNFDEIIELLKKVLGRFGGLFGKFKVNRFKFDLTVGGDDPFKAAQLFGYVNAGISALYPVCRKKFKVRDNYVKTDIDFSAPKHKIEFALAFSIRIGQVLGTIFSILLPLWACLSKACGENSGKSVQISVPPNITKKIF